jgi:hypothetical protein
MTSNVALESTGVQTCISKPAWSRHVSWKSKILWWRSLDCVHANECKNK